MKKIEVEFPDVSLKDVEKIRESFWEKVALPFNEFFQQYVIIDSVGNNQECFEFCMDDLEDNELAWGRLYSLFGFDDSEDEEPSWFMRFYLNGQADMAGPYEGDKKFYGSWEEIMKKVLDFIQKDLESLERAPEVVEKIGKAIEFLSKQGG
ncbi:MAG: hypothetical protein V1819_03700 [bacterium]